MHFRPTSPTRPITPLSPDQPTGRNSIFKAGMWMQKIHSLFSKDDPRCQSPDQMVYCDEDVLHRSLSEQPKFAQHKSDQVSGRSVGVGLPRQATFKRQNSERRERLCPIEPLAEERRAASASRQKSRSCARSRVRTRSTPPPLNFTQAPETIGALEERDGVALQTIPLPKEEYSLDDVYADSVFDYEDTRPPRPLSRTSSIESYDEEQCAFDERALLNAELDTRWILNLSMHFRDKSDREKFFVTYAETPTRWRRVTVSCDYRNAEPGSLEMDLKELSFQRDKSLQIYEAIRDSLPEIQFYNTVTNLKLETSEGRLHVHVTEDVNEIVPYPPRSMVRHVLDEGPLHKRPQELTESEIAFDAHLSGFVYKVSPGGKTYIKKEIPGPDTVDEFLYEVNALHALSYSSNVINLEAIILDDSRELVKGLLISYASQGAIVDILYDHKGCIPWHHRERWAKQAIMGLRDIHEEGYVQGDFTLSNIVVDENNDAKIIDINRRGCPVGWEPPEIAQKIASNQRISMYIGEKSDLYQLGMTLWALAMDDDEPERHDPPLSTDEFPAEVPEWYQEIVRICLSPEPRDRLAAKYLVKMFPMEDEHHERHEISRNPNLAVRTNKQYIDPAAAVERDDIERFKVDEDELGYSPASSRGDFTYTFPRSSNYEYGSVGSTWESRRGRTPASNIEHLSASERARRNLPPSNYDRSYDDVAPQIVDIEPDQDYDYDEVDLDGHPYLVSRGTFSQDQLRILNGLGDEPGTMKLAPTTIPQSPSPFRLPVWRRSVSESTPRNSNHRFTAYTSRSESPNISPRSSSIKPLDLGYRRERTIGSAAEAVRIVPVGSFKNDFEDAAFIPLPDSPDLSALTLAELYELASLPLPPSPEQSAVNTSDETVHKISTRDRAEMNELPILENSPNETDEVDMDAQSQTGISCKAPSVTMSDTKTAVDDTLPPPMYLKEKIVDELHEFVPRPLTPIDGGFHEVLTT